MKDKILILIVLLIIGAIVIMAMIRLREEPIKQIPPVLPVYEEPTYDDCNGLYCKG